ncbi:hypothetical protein BTUL_0038g00340 [Botrytis tulipae]|uniref:Uncharacterized protein n=1 Tax=Botrytis tulipae TaxID=87230 RepID=A0A4Z1ET76_9HELO|nr:hypothetical protein BTUL_0038g00340 [Botrytis tulipae]
MVRLGKANRKVTMGLPASRAIHDEDAATLHCMNLSEKLDFKRMLNQEKITLSTKLNVQGRTKPKLSLRLPQATPIPQDCHKRYSFESRAT